MNKSWRYPDISPPGHFPPCSNQVGRTIPPLFLAGLGHFPSCNIIRGGHFPSHLLVNMKKEKLHITVIWCRWNSKLWRSWSDLIRVCTVNYTYDHYGRLFHTVSPYYAAKIIILHGILTHFECPCVTLYHYKICCGAVFFYYVICPTSYISNCIKYYCVCIVKLEMLL